MNKRRFTWLIIMMVVSLAGITGVQIYWIRSAINIRNENFDNSVINALHQAVGSLESSSRIAFFNDFALRERSLRDSLLNGTVFAGIDALASTYPGGFSINITGQSQISIPNIPDKPADEFSEIIFDGVIPDGDSVTIVITSTEDMGFAGEETMNEPPVPVERRIVMGHDEYIGWLKKRAEEFQRLSEQMISELSDWESRVEIDDRLVKYTLNRVFNIHGVKTPYEFAVIRSGKISGGQYSDGNEEDILTSGYNVRLFPGRMVKDEVLLSVVFPGKRDYVLGSITWILVSSLVFSMIVLATFALSLFFIIRQKKISEMRADFINNMTHEFKTPIATISLAADTITNPKVISDQSGIRHFVSMIKKENSRMNRQVETILQIASLDKHEIQFRFGDVPLHSVIERAVEVMEFQVQQRNGKINLMLEAVDSVVYGDPEHLSNLIHNLLDNANKYSPEAPEITVSTLNRDGGVVISVADKGTGMSKTVQSRIFERFYRQPAGNIHNVKGFGLGLSYVKSIVDAHNGVIEVTSEPGRGSRFDIFLPFNWET
jgi:two-component system, OmpR family, phosphate regulon sensor histidine kinase PhoR